MGRIEPERGEEATRARRSDSRRRENQGSRSARILKLLELLQERSPRDARALSAALGATERTVYRDLKVRELAGVSCNYDPDRGG